LEGVITLVEAQTRVPTTVSVRIDFERDYPTSEPIAFETGRRFAWIDDRHIDERTGRCCLWLPPLSRWSVDDPNALRVFLDQLAFFFDRQLIYDVTGKWPGPAWAHGAPGYWEFVVESLGGAAEAEWFALAKFGTFSRNEPCPCGGGRKYKQCHLSRHDMLARRIKPETRAALVKWRAEYDSRSPRQEYVR
jgi:hypothetical protein